MGSTDRASPYIRTRESQYCIRNVVLKNIILPVVLYECEIWSLTLREEHRLRVFENRLLRRIFGLKRVFENRLLRRILGLKRDEVARGWRKQHNEELHNLFSSPSIITMIKSRRMRWVGHVARIRGKRNAYSIFVGKPEEK
jgi:hypothetical protein